MAVLAAAPARAQRIDEELPSGWKFIQQDAAPTADTAAWQSVTVPHTWDAKYTAVLLPKVKRGHGAATAGAPEAADAQETPADPSIMTPEQIDAAAAPAPVSGDPHLTDGYYRGACWYARDLEIPADWKGRRVFIRFEAAALVADVYLNGQKLGQHRGGFTAFCFELTSNANFGGKNELRVRVDNSHFEDVLPLSGDFDIDGGLYRPVHLLATPAVGISPLDDGSSGVYLATTALDPAAATVEVKTMVANGGGTPAQAQVETEVVDAAGQVVAHDQAPVSVDPQGTAPLVRTIKVPQAHLWNGRKDPYLYTVKVKVAAGAGQPADELDIPFGIRTVEITDEKGFLLNGQPYPIHGVNKHQDILDKGWAMDKTDHDHDAQIMLDMGVTAVRMGHYPQSQYLHEVFDRKGLIAWDELPANEGRSTPEYLAACVQTEHEIVKQLGNHPSVAWWGLYNELNKQSSKAVPAITAAAAFVKEFDPRRTTTSATNHPMGLDKIPDRPCYNQYPGWYGGNVHTWGKLLDAWAVHVGHPRIGVSEYGAGANPAQHGTGTAHATGFYHPEEYQAYIHEETWRQFSKYPNLWGSFVWVMFDIPSARRHEGGKLGINDKGLVARDHQLKKDAYYFYQANWTDAPMVHINSSRWTSRNKPATDVKVYSNLPSVELSVNGKSVGSMTPDEVHLCVFPNVALQQGANEVKAVSGGVADTVHWTFDPAAPPMTPTK